MLPPNINIHSPGFDPYSKEVQDLLKTTNIRIHMTQLHTMGDEALLQTTRQDVKASSLYLIKTKLETGLTTSIFCRKSITTPSMT